MSSINPSLFYSASKKLLLLSAVTLLLVACGSSPVKQTATGSTINPNAKVEVIPPAAAATYANVLTAIDRNDWQKAQTLLAQLREQYPQLNSIPVVQGWVYWQTGNIEQAVNTLEVAIAGKSLYKSDAYNYLAIIYREQGRFNEAETLYRDALQIWSGNPDLHKNLGILYDLYLQRLPDALSHYKQAQALGANDKQLDGWVKDLERRTK